MLVDDKYVIAAIASLFGSMIWAVRSLQDASRRDSEDHHAQIENMRLHFHEIRQDVRKLLETCERMDHRSRTRLEEIESTLRKLLEETTK